MKLSALRDLLKKGIRSKRSEPLSVSGFTMDVYPGAEEFKKIDTDTILAPSTTVSAGLIKGTRIDMIIVDDVIDDPLPMDPSFVSKLKTWFSERQR